MVIFAVIDRDIEQLMAGRGVMIAQEAVRYWC